MSKELHQFTQKFVDHLLKENKYKFIRLLNTEGEPLVFWNNLTGSPVAKKVEEIKNRLKTLPDGVYVLQAKFVYSGKQSPDVYYIQKGKAVLSENTAVIIPKVENTGQQITSVESALDRITEVANLRSELAVAKARITALEAENLELQADLDDGEDGDGLNEPDTSPGGWIKELGQLIPSISDEYFKTKNRELDLKEAGLKVDYMKLRTKNLPVVNSKVRRNPKQVNGQIDIDNPQQLDQLYDHLDSLDDDAFDKQLEHIAQFQPELIPLIEEEFGLNEEEEKK